ISGDKSGDKFGYSVSGKDLNNNSFSDIIVGAPYKDNGTNTDAGAVYVFFGNSTMPSATNASHADNETLGNEANMTLGFSVSYADLNKDGYNDIIAGAYNYSSDKGKVYVLTCRRATLTVSNWTDKAYGKTPAPGENDVLMLNMTLNASECTIRVTNIRVNLTGENAADGDISKVRLIYDADWSGTINAGDEQLGEESFPISGKSLNFTLSFDVSYGTPKHLLLFYNISSGATVGHYVGANLTDYSFISVVRPDNVSNYKFPVNSTNVLITSAVDTLTVSGISVSPEFVNQGNTNITMLNITLSSDNGGDGTVNVTSINISLTGTGTSTNISGVTIYNDTDGSGGLSTGDTQLNTTRTFTDSYVLFGYLNFNVNYGCNAYIFVVYNISSTAIIDSTVGANLTNETKITVDTTNGDTVGSFATIWSNNSTIKKKITYEILNETGVLQTGDWKLWGNWTADPGYIEVNGTNWLRVRNTNGSNPNQQFIVDFTDTYFENATTGGSITIDGNIWFWYFNTTSSTETPNNWIGGGNAIVGVNETDYIEANGAYKFTFNTVGEYIWILYRIEK
ncbi:MAG: hypothetical protein L6265_03300, partial [Thermoplasmatales archaeon]|nr:hypothetical protein [Thermoplasmatales archaeon]